MFTGIIEATGKLVEKRESGGRDCVVTIDVGNLDMSDVKLGDSIAVNGVCLTVIQYDKQTFSANVSMETLSRSGFNRYSIGQAVNLEKALRLQDRLGGHLVSGHVDEQGQIRHIEKDEQSYRVTVVAPESISQYIAEKGSITIDGVSLTVNSVNVREFSVNIVPHTWENTVFATYSIGSVVNLEVDLIARYLERLLTKNSQSSPIGVSKELLSKHGFL